MPISDLASLVQFGGGETVARRARPETRASAARPATSGDGPSLSNSHNFIGVEPDRLHTLTGSHRRMAFVLACEVRALAKDFGLERLGFLTLTIGGKQSPCQADLQERFHSFETNELVNRYSRSIWVVERGTKNGRLHMHGVVVCGCDIRTGVDFERIGGGDYRSANLALRSEWAFWRKTARAYGFGRTEVLPVKTTVEGVAYYLGGYIGKNVKHRVEFDKGARLVHYGGFGPGERRASTRLAWNTDNAWLWRQKLAAFAQRMGVKDFADLQKAFGPRWAWHLQGSIIAEHITGEFPSEAVARREVDADSVREAKLGFAKFGAGQVYAREFALEVLCILLAVRRVVQHGVAVVEDGFLGDLFRLVGARSCSLSPPRSG